MTPELKAAVKVLTAPTDKLLEEACESPDLLVIVAKLKAARELLAGWAIARLAADEAKPGDPLSDLAWIDDARFVPDERGGHIWWNGMKWRPE